MSPSLRLLSTALLGVALTGCPVSSKFTGDKTKSTFAIDDKRDAVAGIRDIVDAVNVSGFVEPVNAPFEVRSEISGKIATIKVAIGDEVKKGQTLAIMDDSLARPDFEEASRTVQFATLQLEKAERDAKRLELLHAEDFATERDVLDARTALELAKLDLAVKRARLDKAKDNLSRTIIFAPYNGIISDLNVSQGQVVVGAGSVNSGTLLMKVNDFSKLQITVKFNEFDAAKISEGKVGDVTFDSQPGKRVKGTISYLSPFAVSDQNQRVFPAKIALDTSAAKVPSGVSANVRMITRSAKGVVAVPVSAIFIDGGERHVYLKKQDNTYEKIRVETGINDDGYIEVRTGLGKGDAVALVRPAGMR